jgi:hypothetical protein
MSGWQPPSIEYLKNSADEYVATVIAPQVVSAIAFRHVSEETRQNAIKALLTIDLLASGAAFLLRDSKWPEERRRASPKLDEIDRSARRHGKSYVVMAVDPREFPPRGVTDKNEIRQWRKAFYNQRCLDACRAARRAIFARRWLEAVVYAAGAGNNSNLSLALSRTPRGRGRNPKNALPKPHKRRHDWGEIFALAAAIHKRDPSLTPWAIAGEIIQGKARGFPTQDTIARRLRKGRHWENDSN